MCGTVAAAPKPKQAETESGKMSMQREMEQVLCQVEKVISGKREVILKILAVLLADGHVLLDDVPGVGKTTLALALSRALGLQFCRVQFTPDVLPSDLTGFSMYDRESGRFVYHPGMLQNAQLLLGDEINRTSSKTQSALLEAMEERQVSVDGITHALQRPFMVIATQNNVGMLGTQRLPYAQMDRFMAALSMGYPDYEAQMEMLKNRQAQNPMDSVETVMDAAELLALQKAAQAISARDTVLDYMTRLTMASRNCGDLEVAISPRGTLHLCRMAKAWAFLQGRDYVTAGDVQDVFADTCRHRLVLSRSARAKGLEAERVLLQLLEETPNPDRGAAW